MQASPYVLRADGHLHEADIRGVATTCDGLLLSASRDNTAQLSCLPPPPAHAHNSNDDNNNDSSDTLVTQLTFIGHTAFVNVVLYCDALALVNGSACCVTCSNDTHVAVWNVHTGRLEAVLDGHTQGVCAGIQLHHTAPSSPQQPQQQQQHTDGSDGAATGGAVPAWCGDLVTGDWGGVCVVFDSRTGRVRLRYTQHTTAIRGLAQLSCEAPLVVSASGDKTAHVWDAVTGATLRVCVGHADVVQCVAALDGVVATGSNDCTLRVWDMRHVCSSSNSSSNARCHDDEATEAAADVRREVVVTHSAVLHGHASLIYAVTWHKRTRELLSASEDHSVMVWRRQRDDTTMTAAGWTAVQQLHHPCVVWCVAVRYAPAHERRCSSNNNNDDKNNSDSNVYDVDDIVTGGADGVLRVWTRNAAAHAASIGKRDALARAIASRRVDVKEAVDVAATTAAAAAAAAAATTPASTRATTTTSSAAAATASGLDVTTMPSVVALHARRGTHEGERAFARNDADEVELYTWSAGAWTKVGVVVAGPQHTPYRASSGSDNNNNSSSVAAQAAKQYHEGVAYDYVFDVDVQGTMLRLSYNRGDDILDTAQRFVDDHAGVVHQDSKEEITNFLLAQLAPEDVALATRPRDNTDSNNSNSNNHTATSTAATTLSSTAAATAAAAVSPLTLFAAYNASGAQRKVNELLLREGSNSSSSSSSSSVVATIATTRHGSTSDNAEANVMQQLVHARGVDELLSLCDALSRLHMRLPHAEAWVLLDALRYVLVHPSLAHTPATLTATAAASTQRSSSSSSTDDDTTVATRRVLACVVRVAARLLQLTPDAYTHQHHDEESSHTTTAAVAAAGGWWVQRDGTCVLPATLSSDVVSVVAQLRFAANVMGVLCLTHSHSGGDDNEEDEDDAAVAGAAGGELSLFAHTSTPRAAPLLLLWAAELARAHARRSDTAVRAACAAVLRNAALLLQHHGSALQAVCADAATDTTTQRHTQHTQQQQQHTTAAAVALLYRRVVDSIVVAVAQMLLSERSGSPLTPQLLSVATALYTAAGLLSRGVAHNAAALPATAAAAATALSSWHCALRTQAHTLLYFTLQAIATGADVHCHAQANALLAVCSDNAASST